MELALQIVFKMRKKKNRRIMQLSIIDSGNSAIVFFPQGLFSREPEFRFCAFLSTVKTRYHYNDRYHEILWPVRSYCTCVVYHFCCTTCTVPLDHAPACYQQFFFHQFRIIFIRKIDKYYLVIGSWYFSLSKHCR